MAFTPNDRNVEWFFLCNARCVRKVSSFSSTEEPRQIHSMWNSPPLLGIYSSRESYNLLAAHAILMLSETVYGDISETVAIVVSIMTSRFVRRRCGVRTIKRALTNMKTALKLQIKHARASQQRHTRCQRRTTTMGSQSSTTWRV